MRPNNWKDNVNGLLQYFFLIYKSWEKYLYLIINKHRQHIMRQSCLFTIDSVFSYFNMNLIYEARTQTRHWHYWHNDTDLIWKNDIIQCNHKWYVDTRTRLIRKISIFHRIWYIQVCSYHCRRIVRQPCLFTVSNVFNYLAIINQTISNKAIQSGRISDLKVCSRNMTWYTRLLEKLPK
jgi:hypothetical protein